MGGKREEVRGWGFCLAETGLPSFCWGIFCFHWLFSGFFAEKVFALIIVGDFVSLIFMGPERFL